MARDRAKRKHILQALRKRLISQIDDWSDSTCFISDSANPLTIPPGESFCIISPSAASAIDQFYAGGGHMTLTLHAQVEITVWLQRAIDTAGRLEEALLQEDNGLVSRFEENLLRALLNEEWEMEFDGNQLLRDALSLVSISAPMLQDGGGLSWVGITYTFLTVFDYDLSTT